MTASAYTELMAHMRTVEALGQVSQLLGWDQEAMMPPRGGPQRSEQMAAVGAVTHAQLTDPRVGDWLDAVEADLAGDNGLDATARSNIALIRRRFDREVRIPGTLRAELARKTSRGQQVWAEARAADDFAAFAPVLSEVLELKRQEAACLQQDGTLYDGLLDTFEPGMTSAVLTPLFARLRKGLTAIAGRIGADGWPARAHPAGPFPAAAQRALCRDLAGLFGYRLEAGRLDEVTHPFCTGTGGDVRITTRIDEARPFGSIFSTIHETGHAVYEQNIDPDLMLQPAGSHASMGIHESQSRLLENQIGRSRPFCTYLSPAMQAAFPGIDIPDPDTLYRLVNAVAPGYIRTDADEIHYNLHILMRTDLERDLIEGRLAVADLEEAWNTRFEADFGLPVDRPSHGVLQDVHWSCGLVGYFPTYTLGNLYAAALFARMRSDIDGLEDKVAAGQMGAAIAWLTEHVHRHGSLATPQQILTRALGGVPDEGPLLAYLDAKFGALYP